MEIQTNGQAFKLIIFQFC